MNNVVFIPFYCVTFFFSIKDYALETIVFNWVTVSVIYVRKNNFLNNFFLVLTVENKLIITFEKFGQVHVWLLFNL